MRLVRGGPWVGAAIWWTEADGWSCMVDGETFGPSADPWAVPNLDRVHWGGRETTEAEVLYRLGLKQHATLYNPDHPAAKPNKPIDLDDYKPL